MSQCDFADESHPDSEDDGGNGKGPPALCLKHNIRLVNHEVLLKSLDLEAKDNRAFVRGLSKTFGEILAATNEIKIGHVDLKSGYQRIVDKLVLIDSTIKQCDEKWGERLTEHKIDSQRVCSLHRATFEQRIGTLEKIDDKTDDRIRRVEDMGENSKIRYIGELQAELQGQKTKWFSWKLAVFSSVVGLLCAAAGVLGRGCLEGKPYVTTPAVTAPVLSK